MTRFQAIMMLLGGISYLLSLGVCTWKSYRFWGLGRIGSCVPALLLFILGLFPICNMVLAIVLCIDQWLIERSEYAKADTSFLTR